MAEYMLLLHEKEGDFNGFSAEEIQKIIEEYITWSEQTAASGKLIDGRS